MAAACTQERIKYPLRGNGQKHGISLSFNNPFDSQAERQELIDSEQLSIPEWTVSSSEYSDEVNNDPALSSSEGYTTHCPVAL